MISRTKINKHIILALGIFPSLAFANGYHFLHQSAEGLGSAYSTNGTAHCTVVVIQRIPEALRNGMRFASVWGTSLSVYNCE